MLDLDPECLKIITANLEIFVPDAEVRAFGSRVNGGAKKYSDIDLAIIEREKISFDRMRLLKEALQNSELPIRVDLVDWHRISDTFKKIIESGFITIRPAEKDDQPAD